MVRRRQRDVKTLRSRGRDRLMRTQYAEAPASSPWVPSEQCQSGRLASCRLLDLGAFPSTPALSDTARRRPPWLVVPFVATACPT